ncbi:MAG: hypothetical protein NW226_21330 [Microscillaceae bacterium]|nr:hypothetical protein [Microscillaceae bacterium]
MTRTFTQDDLIRYIYGETSDQENQMIKTLLATDTDFQDKYQYFLEVVSEMDSLSEAPSERVIQRIIDSSRRSNLHSV